MAEYELKNGITTICPASMTFSEEKLSEIIRQQEIMMEKKEQNLLE